MISNKTLAIIFIVALNMQLVASTTPNGAQESSPSVKSTPLVKKRESAPKPGEVLAGASNTVNDVEVHRESTEETSISQELPVSQVSNPFKASIEKEEYEKIFELGKEMSDEEFLEQLCPVIETLDQYDGIVDPLKSRNLTASFYVFGNIEVVKGAILESSSYARRDHLGDGDLETALPLALERDRHDRVIELLGVRKEITAENDGQPKQNGGRTSFEWFVYYFLHHLAPWEDGTALRRFLILLGDELRNKHHDILDTLCQHLVFDLRNELDSPKAKSLLIDLIGQPLLLTPVVFAREFLLYNNDECRFNFIKYGWREAFEEGLKAEHRGGGEKLWRMLQKVKPEQFNGQFPETEEARAAACMHFPTKREKEIQWIRKNAPGFLETVELALVDIFPTVLIPIVIEYVRLTLIDVPSTKPQ